MATIVIPSLMRKFTAGHDRVTVSGRNMREALADLDRQFPGVARELIEDGDIKPSIAVSIDGEVSTNGILETIRENSEIHFMPQISGGA